MFRSIRKEIGKSYYAVIHSIAFIPSCIIMAFTILGLILISLKGSDFSHEVIKVFPWIEMTSATLASAIVTTLLAGVISLTVFSFSMVMVVLNQASSNFTPKVLTQIVQDRSNQVVLGFYVGTIVYYIILLMNFTKESDEFRIPDIAFFVAIVLAIFNIILFVNFIHNITLSIQVKKIINMLYADTKSLLKIDLASKADEEERKAEVSLNGYEWIPQYSTDSGYLQRVMQDLTSYLKENDLVIKMEAEFGEYILKGQELFSSNKALSHEMREEISSYFVYHMEEVIDENDFYGFRQISEIAVKALSPGINDPGTAVICIDYVTDLLSMKAEALPQRVMYDKEGNIRVFYDFISYEKILYTCFTPIRVYGAADPIILKRLLQSVYKLAVRDLQAKRHRKIYEQHALAIQQVAAKQHFSSMDREHINTTLQKLNKLRDYGLSLPMLEG